VVAPRGIVTPEAVVLEFETAGPASRLLAGVIDAVIQLLALMAVSFGAVGINAAGADLGGLGTAALYVLVFLLMFGYSAVLETVWRGRTVGKAAMGLRVVTVEGAPIGFRHAAIRSILGLVDKYLFFSGLIGIVSILVTRRNQRLGDLAAGTIVLRERTAAKAPTATELPIPAGLESYAATLDLSGLSTADYTTVRSFLVRAGSLAPEVRSDLARQLAVPVSQRLRTQPPPGVSAELFLQCVAGAVQHRSSAPPAPTVDSVWEQRTGVSSAPVVGPAAAAGGFAPPQ
jgi:uncharacterized RDD family membrane protein YckC